jgi:uncharacterized membrane protein YgcG
MYKKRNNRVLLTLVLLIAGLVVGLIVLKAATRPKRPDITETESSKHQILIYKSSGGGVEFEQKWLKKETDTELKLSITDGTMVTLLIHPKSGKVLKDVTLNETDNVHNTVDYLVNDTGDGDKKRVNFVMPDKNLLMNITYADKETEPSVPAPETEAEPETTYVEQETETPYNLKLHGLTAEILTSYMGRFNDQAFLQQLGDDLYIRNEASDYRGVRDVTFSDEGYSGPKEKGNVYHYVYFNNDKDFKVLCTYFPQEDRYLFTDPNTALPVSESESQSETAAQTSTGTSAGTSAVGSYGGGSGSYGGGGSTQTGSTTVTSISLDIMQVSKNLVEFCGGKDRFYDQVFHYVELKGLSGEIVGTMDSYKIDPEKEKASFSISLSSGQTISGSYEKSSNEFSFSGL